MPAIITHDTFGHETYSALYEFIGGSRDEANAFILGNQGPDPLFYSVVCPHLKPVHRLGSLMHSEKPTELLAALHDALRNLSWNSIEDQRIARAYAMGFMCHYLLDSTAHPFVFFYEHELCDAGVEGLTREDNHEVHALIESEIDELILTMRRNASLSKFNPSKSVLQASDRTLHVVSALYCNAVQSTYGQAIPKDTFITSVKCFRAVQALFYSPTGLKHNLIGRIELLARRHSFYRAMSHRNLERTWSPFANAEHAEWVNPFSGETETSSFDDLFDRAKMRAIEVIAQFDVPNLGAEGLAEITGGLNFSGEDAYARIISVEETA